MEVEVKETESVRNFFADWSKQASPKAFAPFAKMELHITHDMSTHVGKLDAYLGRFKKPRNSAVNRSYSRLLRGLYVHAHKGRSKRKHWSPHKPLKLVEVYVLGNSYVSGPPETVHVPSSGLLEINHTYTFEDPHAVLKSEEAR